MAKSAITKKYNISANGILVIEDSVIGLEITETGDFIDLSELLSDFANRSVKLSVSYDEDYDTVNE